jgi:hypothetical protein
MPKPSLEAHANQKPISIHDGSVLFQATEGFITPFIKNWQKVRGTHAMIVLCIVAQVKQRPSVQIL